MIELNKSSTILPNVEYKKTIKSFKLLNYYADFQAQMCMLCLYCDTFNVQQALYFPHTACAAAPIFTLCLKPQASLL